MAKKINEKKFEEIARKLNEKQLEEIKQAQRIKKSYEDYWKEKGNKHTLLLKNIKKDMKGLEKLYKEASDHWEYEDPVYRYYHGSFKVYRVQGLTSRIFTALMDISPHKDSLGNVNRDFMEIFMAGHSEVFDISHNKEWGKHCRPILEAFFHARFFLEMAIKYGKELKKAPDCLPSGWACLLYLYNLR